MNIVAPLSHKDEIKYLLNSGANEIYCGVLTEEWKNKFVDFASVDRRPYPHACLKNYNELEMVTQYGRKKGVPVYLTINEFYSNDQIPMIITHIAKAKEAGIAGLIIADFPLLFHLKNVVKKKSLKIHISGRANVLNKKALGFFKELGADRIILPRQITLEEAKIISEQAKVLNMETEVFILNLRCRFLDGFCTFYHKSNGLIKNTLKLRTLKVPWLKHKPSSFLGSRIRPKLQKIILKDFFGCCLDYDVETEGNRPIPENLKNRIRNSFGLEWVLNSCGACSLYRLNKIGVTQVKIVGRENELEKKINDIQFIKETLLLLKTGITEEQFIETSKVLYTKFYSIPCNSKLCYYPATSNPKALLKP